MEYLKINGESFFNMVVNASNNLEEQKEYVNSLNVFPVPDGDTGTNMSMTFKSAVKDIESMNHSSIGEISRKLARGALMGARGNSGVILSQIFRGIAKGLENKNEINSDEFAKCILEGSKFAYKAVMRPTEGTILTIIRAAGECAVKSKTEDITKLMSEICKYSEIVLSKTPEMLSVLKKAKVVDAGGYGLLVILKGMYDVLYGGLENLKINNDVDAPKKEFKLNFDVQDIKYGYCTEFLIHSHNVDLKSFKDELEPLGDSMVVVGFEDVVKVHIHTNDPGAVITKAASKGELTKIKIDNMREQHKDILGLSSKHIADKSVSEVEETEEVKKYAFVSVSMGEGIKNIFKDLGVNCVIAGGQTMNPSTKDFVEAINSLNAENIFVFPNNKNIIMAATQAVNLIDKNVIVIPTKTVPQGITAITVFNPEALASENEDAMNESILKVQTGSITYAIRDTQLDDTNIVKGDILGLIEGKILKTGSSIFEVCDDIITKMLNDDSELLTLFYGEDCDALKVKDFVKTLEEKYPNIDIQCYDGKQPLYYFIISVE